MRVGVCTTDFSPRPAGALFQRIRELGFETVQFNFSAVDEAGFMDTGVFEIPGAVDRQVLREIRTRADACRLHLIAVNGTFNCAHPDPAVREEGVERFHGFIEAVYHLGAKMVSLCTGTRNTAHLWRPHPDNGREDAYRDSLHVVRRLTKIAARRGIHLLIEVEASNVIDTPEKAARMMSDVGDEHLKIVMDCANLFHPGTAHPDRVRPTIDEAFRHLGRDILLAHGKDILQSDGINFCATGEGIVDFPYFIECLRGAGYAGDMVLHGIYDEEKMRVALARMREWAG